MTKAHRIDALDSILKAAIQVATEKGAGHVTLDAVAKLSGMSKGGVLYHFPTKDALLQGTLEKLISDTRTRREQMVTDGLAESAIEALLLSRHKSYPEVSQNLAMAIMAAAAEKPDLLQPVREYFSYLLHRLENENQDIELAVIIWLASEGLLSHKLLNLTPLTEPLQQQIVQRLMLMAKELT